MMQLFHFIQDLFYFAYLIKKLKFLGQYLMDIDLTKMYWL